MIGAYVMPEKELTRFIGRLMEERAVMGPRERPDQPGHHTFDWLEKPEQFAPEYQTTTLPPKKAFFPPRQTLFTFTLERPPKLKLVRDETPFVLAGVHPCDLAAIEALDAAYSQPPSDVPWQINRRRASVIGMDCLPDEYCFCTTFGTEAARKPCDLFLTPVEEGYLVEVHTPKGGDLLGQARTEPAGAEALGQAEAHRRRKADMVRAGFDATPKRLAKILESGGLTEVWQEVARRCYSCGSCNTTCPTCFCFDMDDAFDLTLRSGRRVRTWDSCQLQEFATVAGGHNFREERWQRVRHRWHRKFVYLFRQLGRPYCVGCGRCSRACTADINIVDVTNGLIAAGRKEAAHA